jgi:hypothetical protein
MMKYVYSKISRRRGNGKGSAPNTNAILCRPACLLRIIRDIRSTPQHDVNESEAELLVSTQRFQSTLLMLSRSLSALCFIWGGIAAAMGAVNDWQSLTGVRFALGVVEAGFAPGVAFYFSSWYKKHELARR